MKRKRNKKVWDALTTKHSDYLIQAGWFENSKYSNGMPIGGIAAVQNYGAVIHQTVTEKQKAYFHSQGIHLKKDTHDLHIVIPATHFWENAQEKNKVKWRQNFKDAWTSVFIGNTNPDTAMETIASNIVLDIAREITDGDYPPDKPSTVRAKMSRYANKKKKGNLDKRLIDTGQMLNALIHKVTKI